MKKKVLSITLVIALASIVVIGVTLAFFTDTTQTETNVFTVGNVTIHLTEPRWNPDNSHILPAVTIPKDPTITVDEKSDDAYVFMDLNLNKYVSFLKLVGLNEGWVDDPNDANGIWPQWTAAIENGSYKAIVDKWFAGIDYDKWDVMNEEALLVELNKMASGNNATRITFEIAYKDIQTANDSVTLFTSVTIPTSVTSEMIEVSGFNTDLMEWELKLTAKAIQAQGIANYKDAYTALYTP